MESEAADNLAVRHVGPLLATAIFAVPVVFYWLLLRRGYASSTRRAAFFYMVARMLPGVIVVLVDGTI